MNLTIEQQALLQQAVDTAREAIAHFHAKSAQLPVAVSRSLSHRLFMCGGTQLPLQITPTETVAELTSYLAVMQKAWFAMQDWCGSKDSTGKDERMLCKLGQALEVMGKLGI